MKNKTIIYIIAIFFVAILLALGLSLLNKESGPGPYDYLATCLKEKGATFYGAFWCPHCRDQKKEFGVSAKLLPYVECSNPSATGQLQVCTDKKIQSYPTWEFADGTRVSKVLTPEQLSEKTSCPITPAVASTTPSIQ